MHMFPVMISLKAFLPVMSEQLGRSPAALYERQRALVRLGILSAPTNGRGPGSGVRATPETVLPILLSVLITDNLSEIDQRVSDLASLPHKGDKNPELAG